MQSTFEKSNCKQISFYKIVLIPSEVCVPNTFRKEIDVPSPRQIHSIIFPWAFSMRLHFQHKGIRVGLKISALKLALKKLICCSWSIKIIVSCMFVQYNHFSKMILTPFQIMYQTNDLVTFCRWLDSMTQKKLCLAFLVTEWSCILKLLLLLNLITHRYVKAWSKKIPQIRK